jgi:TolB-like protein
VPESRFVRPLSSLLVRVLCLILGLLALPASAADKPTVAVLYFGYGGKTPEMEVLRKGLAQMMISDLSGFGTVRLVERDRLQEILDELNLAQSSKFDAATVAKVGKLLGAQYLVMGDYFDLLNNLRVDARVIEVQTGQIIRSLGARGSADEFFTLEQKLSQDINKVLEELVAKAPEPTPKPAPQPSGSPGAPQPSRMARRLTVKTALRYSKALDAKDRKDVETAKKELTAVIAEEPDFVLASADLARLMK